MAGPVSDDGPVAEDAARFEPSDEYKRAKAQLDRLTYRPPLLFFAAMVGVLLVGQRFGLLAAQILGIPVLIVLAVWLVRLVRATLRTFTILRDEQRSWRARHGG